MSATRVAALLVAAGLASPGAVEAQNIALRLGGGPAIATDVGVTGLVGIEAGYRGAILRLEGRPAYVPGKLEGGEASVGFGLRPRYARAAGGPYVLATLARQMDVREGDWATGLGLAAGLDLGGRLLAPYLEVRYEHLFQDSPVYYSIPPDHVALLLGLRLGRS